MYYLLKMKWLVEDIINFVEKGNLYRSYSSQFDGWYETGSNPIINSFLYLFYPLFDFSSLFRIIISLENLTIVSLILLAVIKFNKKSFLEIIPPNPIPTLEVITNSLL